MKRALLSIIFIISASAVGSAQTFTYYFPQVVDGTTWQTTIMLSNTMATGTGVATITFTKSDGTPFMANWIDEMGNNVTAGGNTITASLRAGESRKFMTIGDIELTTGYATVVSNSSAMLGNAMFTQYDEVGNRLGEAGVPMAIPLGKQALFVDTTSGFRTGVAIANPNNVALQVHFELVNDMGQLVTSKLITLGASQHMSLFVDELFGGGVPVMVGRLQFWCTNPMTSVGLRFSSAGLPFTTLAPLAVAN
jgi:hypothetical protein